MDRDQWFEALLLWVNEAADHCNMNARSGGERPVRPWMPEEAFGTREQFLGDRPRSRDITTLGGEKIWM
jgi:hypothetical protein